MEEKKHLVGGISRKTLERLPVYHHYLERRDSEGLVNISAPVIALDLQLNEVQVRKLWWRVRRGSRRRVT